MKRGLTVDFSIDRKSNTIQIKKEFAAAISLVWQAWTTQEWLDQWWGPQPWHVETKTQDFVPDGIWMYAMVSPEGDKNWSLSRFIDIDDKKSFSYKPGFCDEDGIINTDLPQSKWNVEFTQADGHTLVHCKIVYNESKDLEGVLAMGFKEGLKICLQQLDDLIERKTSN